MTIANFAFSLVFWKALTKGFPKLYFFLKNSNYCNSYHGPTVLEMGCTVVSIATLYFDPIYLSFSHQKVPSCHESTSHTLCLIGSILLPKECNKSAHVLLYQFVLQNSFIHNKLKIKIRHAIIDHHRDHHQFLRHEYTIIQLKHCYRKS